MLEGSTVEQQNANNNISGNSTNRQLKRERLTPFSTSSIISGNNAGATNHHHDRGLLSVSTSHSSHAVSNWPLPYLSSNNNNISTIPHSKTGILAKSIASTSNASVAVQTSTTPLGDDQEPNESSDDINVTSTPRKYVDQGTSTDAAHDDDEEEDIDDSPFTSTFPNRRRSGVSNFRRRIPNSVQANNNGDLPSVPIMNINSQPLLGNQLNSHLSKNVEELQRMNVLESILIKDLHELDRAAEELARRRTSLTRQLTDLHHSRSEWMMQLICDEKNSRARHGRRSVPVLCSLDSIVAANTLNLADDRAERRLDENEVVADSSVSHVSSSQERVSSPLQPNDNNEEFLQRQRCTSTSHSPPAHNGTKHRGQLSIKNSPSYEDDHSSESDCETRVPSENASVKVKDDVDRLTNLSKTLNSVNLSSSGDIVDLDIQVTRRLSSSSKSVEELLEEKVEVADGDISSQVLMPDTVGDTPCVVENLSNACKVEFNVSHEDGCSVHKFTHNSDDSFIDISEQPSELPQKLLAASQSPKSRNSSGSDHSYSLRSRGPPALNKSKKCKRVVSENKEISGGVLTERTSSPDQSLTDADKDLIEVEQSEEDREDDDDRSSQSLSAASSVDSSDSKGLLECLRYKRKRRTRKHGGTNSSPSAASSNSGKRRKINSSSSPSRLGTVTASASEKKASSSSSSFSPPPTRRRTADTEGNTARKQKQNSTKREAKYDLQNTMCVVPPAQKDSILDIVVSFFFTIT